MKKWPAEDQKPQPSYYNTIINTLNRKVATYKALCIFLIIVFVIQVGVNVYIASLPKTVPYVIEISADGDAKYLRDTVKLLDDWQPSEDTTRLFIGNFIENLRNVSTDRQVTTANLLKVYAMMTANAADQIKSYIKDTDPINRGKTEKVMAKVYNISKLSDQTYQVDWRETVTTTTDRLISDKQYRAILQITFYRPRTEEQRENNPLGLWITDISVSAIKDL